MNARKKFGKEINAKINGTGIRVQVGISSYFDCNLLNKFLIKISEAVN
jgi:hypothetical protein